jgi:hypothetical protein
MCREPGSIATEDKGLRRDIWRLGLPRLAS